MELGLVDAVVPDSSAESFVRELIEKISEKPYETVSTIKAVMVNSMNSEVSAGLEYEATAFGHLLATEETRKRISDFISKHSHDNQGSR
jgi:enoyl-CoA hydratase/carnithine racemase